MTSDPTESTSTASDFDTISNSYLCNGHAHLCDVPLDRVTFLRTHNSHAAFAKGYLKGAANHHHAIPKQLADGVRALNVDVYKDGPNLLLYHGFKDLGSESFDAAMAEIVTFMTANPREVLILGLQVEAPRADIAAGFEASGLVAYMHVHPKGAAWPTLGAMISSGKRLFLYAGGSGKPAWMHNTGSFVYGTNWGTKRKEDFNCSLTMPPFENGLFELDHTLTNPVARPGLADANHNPFLHNRVMKCFEEHGKMPNMISLDWYSIGDGLAEVDALNSLTKPSE